MLIFRYKIGCWGNWKMSFFIWALSTWQLLSFFQKLFCFQGIICPCPKSCKQYIKCAFRVIILRRFVVNHNSDRLSPISKTFTYPQAFFSSLKAIHVYHYKNRKCIKSWNLFINSEFRLIYLGLKKKRTEWQMLSVITSLCHLWVVCCKQHGLYSPKQAWTLVSDSKPDDPLAFFLVGNHWHSNNSFENLFIFSETNVSAMYHK